MCLCKPRCFAIALVFTAGLASAAWLSSGTEVGASTPAASARLEAALEVKQFTVDPVHSAAIFGIEWGGMTPFYGQFNTFSGTVTYDGQDVSTFSCDIAIPLDGIDTHNEQRDRHLKSPDFFNAREYPNISFKSTKLTDNGDGTWTLAGDLTMRGNTHPVEGKVTHLSTKAGQGGERCGISATFTIKRSQWEVDHMVGQGLGDDVTLMVSIQSAAQGA